MFFSYERQQSLILKQRRRRNHLGFHRDGGEELFMHGEMMFQPLTPLGAGCAAVRPTPDRCQQGYYVSVRQTLANGHCFVTFPEHCHGLPPHEIKD